MFHRMLLGVPLDGVGWSGVGRWGKPVMRFSMRSCRDVGASGRGQRRHKATYLCAYTARALLLVAMRRAGLKRLTGADRISVENFARAFPDEKSWFTLLSGSHTDTLHKFFEDLNYSGRPEFWSMFACLLLTRAMWRNPDWYVNHKHELKAALRSQLHHGLQRVPALCVSDVLSS